MQEHNAKIKNATLGLEDHGIPTSWLHMSWDSSGQGFGGLNLKAQGAMLRWVMGIQSALGLSDWSQVEGTVCRIRREDGKIVAIGHILEDRWFTLEMMSDMSITTEKGA